MSTIVDRFEKIKSKITSLKPLKPVNIIAVSKTFALDYIKPLIDHGHSHFGENKVQEALAKWTEQKKIKKNIKLHMVGKLQSNKAKDAVKHFPSEGEGTISGIIVEADEETGLAKKVSRLIIGGNLEK